MDEKKAINIIFSGAQTKVPETWEIILIYGSEKPAKMKKYGETEIDLVEILQHSISPPKIWIKIVYHILGLHLADNVDEEQDCR